jgi:hypothetical protein
MARQSPSLPPALRVGRLRFPELEGALVLTRAEGWPHTMEDWLLHFKFGLGLMWRSSVAKTFALVSRGLG